MSDINSPAYGTKYVAGLLDQLSASQAREAELSEKMEEWKDAAQDAAKRLLAAESKIKASQEQEPYRRLAEMVRGMLVPVDVFTAPVIPPDLAELQLRLDKTVEDFMTVQRNNAELRKLLEASKVPEGCTVERSFIYHSPNKIEPTVLVKFPIGYDTNELWKQRDDFASMLSQPPKESTP